MNKLKSVFISLICVALIGCATRTTTTGREFDASKLGDIKKKVTTSDELVGLLGQPFSKSVKSEDEVIWYYSWVKATSTARMGWNTPNVKTEGYKKNLEVLIKNGVIVNYTFDEGPFQIESREGSK
jgi:hypothetical protein